MRFGHGVIGGTFDHLHSGHKYFIDNAFSECEFVTIGLTVDEYVEDKAFFDLIQSFTLRKNELIKYLKSKNFDKRTHVIPIKDIYGPTLTKKNIDVIFVSAKGVKNALKINEKRRELGFSEIKIIRCKYIKDNIGDVLSSTKIRQGHDNRDGFVYKTQLENANILNLPYSLRSKLRSPFGKIIKNFDKKKLEGRLIIAVGDIVVSKLNMLGVVPNISIYDCKSERAKILDKEVLKYIPKEDVVVKNSPGTISGNAVKILDEAISNLSTQKIANIRVIGEEDLLALPAILLSPLNALVIYGIRGEGSVITIVSEKLKEQIRTDFISKFIK